MEPLASNAFRGKDRDGPGNKMLMFATTTTFLASLMELSGSWQSISDVSNISIAVYKDASKNGEHVVEFPSSVFASFPHGIFGHLCSGPSELPMPRRPLKYPRIRPSSGLISRAQGAHQAAILP